MDSYTVDYSTNNAGKTIAGRSALDGDPQIRCTCSTFYTFFPSVCLGPLAQRPIQLLVQRPVQPPLLMPVDTAIFHFLFKPASKARGDDLRIGHPDATVTAKFVDPTSDNESLGNTLISQYPTGA